MLFSNKCIEKRAGPAYISGILRVSGDAKVKMMHTPLCQKAVQVEQRRVTLTQARIEILSFSYRLLKRTPAPLVFGRADKIIGGLNGSRYCSNPATQCIEIADTHITVVEGSHLGRGPPLNIDHALSEMREPIGFKIRYQSRHRRDSE
jgi:hypothetical protein